MDGVFVGCWYVDSADGTPKWRSYFPASTSAQSGDYIRAHVIDDPDATFLIQADASVTAGQVGQNIDVSVTSGNEGSTTTGQSNLFAHVSTLDTTARAFRILGVHETPDNGFDAFPVLEVKYNLHRDFFVTATAA